MSYPKFNFSPTHIDALISIVSKPIKVMVVLVKKNSVQKNLDQNIFEPKNFVLKKCGPKKFKVNKFWSKNFLYQKMLGSKN